MNYYQTFSITTLVILAKGLDIDIREFFMEDEELEEREKIKK